MKMSDLNKYESIGNYHIRLEVTYGRDFNFYTVGLYEYGKEVKSNVYGLDERKAALACFRRYVKIAQ